MSFPILSTDLALANLKNWFASQNNSTGFTAFLVDVNASVMMQTEVIDLDLI